MTEVGGAFVCVHNERAEGISEHVCVCVCVCFRVNDICLCFYSGKHKREIKDQV